MCSSAFSGVLEICGTYKCRGPALLVGIIVLGFCDLWVIMNAQEGEGKRRARSGIGGDRNSLDCKRTEKKRKTEQCGTRQSNRLTLCVIEIWRRYGGVEMRV